MFVLVVKTQDAVSQLKHKRYLDKYLFVLCRAQQALSHQMKDASVPW
jgi:hypothetical protein